MSAENGDLNWTEILRQAGGPQNLSPIATAQVFLLSAMLREERKRMETSNDSNGAINSVPRVAMNHQAGDTKRRGMEMDQTREVEMER